MASPPPPVGCAAAAQAATAWAGLPDGLLEAIGVVESGRFNRMTGTTTPSPYAVDADGAGHRFASAAEAADFARQSMASGARAVDVGCFQIDLQDHPDAFASLDDAFTPTANADYAAQFLLRLHAKLGSWEAAIGAYHSATPALGLPYAKQVNAVWHGEIAGNPAAANDPPMRDPYVIRLAASHGVLPKIITP
ncbi:MAG TPA: hypothetical protein VF286_00420 [Acidiphilium sp.]